MKTTKKLEQLLSQLKEASNNFLGYPVSKDFDYTALYEFLSYPINNLGDPYEPSTYRVQTHEMEKEVIGFFAHLFRAQSNDHWGYVTNGGSESNLYGLYIARELYPKAMVYYSVSTHYSVKKNIHLLNIPSIVIRSTENGEMDYEDLENTLQFNRHRPAIILASFGTTMKEAKDDVKRIKQILKKLAIQDHYLHCDAALSGAYGAFIEPRVPFDFEDGADSIAVSGHKFIGSPIPCGIVLTRRSLRDRIAKGVAYIGSSDTTITGSRNGHAVLFLWYAIQQLGLDGLRERYLKSLSTAAYCKQKLQELGVPAWSNEGAITVVFPKTSVALKEKWQLATEDLTHIVCMPNVDRAQIDQFVMELEAEMRLELA